MDIKLIGTDLDGTFNHGDTIHPANIEAVAQARSRGMIVSACTTRNHYAGKGLFEAGEFDDLTVICNGGGIMNWRTTEMLYEKPIEPRHVRTLFELCQEYSLSCGAFTPMRLVSYKPVFDIVYPGGGGFVDFPARFGTAQSKLFSKPIAEKA